MGNDATSPKQPKPEMILHGANIILRQMRVGTNTPDSEFTTNGHNDTVNYIDEIEYIDLELGTMDNHVTMLQCNIGKLRSDHSYKSKFK